ncbi:MAG: hypothetical protein CSA11_07165 [Chloroflexi bacterium]|nr:MAG: hypothetical protein CSA11_07165 [Chloroflexota bacterium]
MDDAIPTTTSTDVRPRSATLVLWGVFLLGAWNFGRVLAFGQQMDLLLELAVQPDSRFRFMLALIWGFVFLGLWWLIRQKRPFTRKLTPLILILYAVYELSLTILFAQTPLARQAIWLNLSIYLFLILFVTWALNRTAVDHYYHANK